MKNIFALIGLGLFGFATLGWYLGWYKIQTSPTAEGHRNISIDVNSPKISQDLKKGKQELKEILTGDNKPSTSTPGVPGLPGTSTTPPNTITIPGTDVTVGNLPPAPMLPGLPSAPPPGNQPGVFFGPDGQPVFTGGELTLPGGVTVKTPSVKLPKLPSPQ